MKTFEDTRLVPPAPRATCLPGLGALCGLGVFLCAVCAGAAGGGAPGGTGQQAYNNKTGPGGTGGVFTTAETPAVATKGGDYWALHDWRGREVRAGIAPEGGLVTLPGLPCGYYVFAGAGGGEISNVIVVPDPAKRRDDPAGTICADTALSWLAAPQWFDLPESFGDSFEYVAELLRLAGLRRVRERMSWGTVQPSGDAPPDWGNFGENARRLKERGIAVCDMFQSAPEWTHRIAKLPGDFAALFRFSADCARELDATDAWEFWNEQIEGFAPEPVWDFAAAMNAAALGFRAGNPGALVLNGSLCKAPGNDYDRLLYENEIGKYTDVRNIHAYLPLSLYADRIGKMREFAEKTGEGGKAIWLTELGTMALGPGLLPGRNRAERTFTPEQEILNAEFFPKSQALAAMEGVDRSYYFVFAAYSEDGGSKEFSIIRRNGTPAPAFAAISTMTDKTAGFALVGELDAPEGVRAFLYEDSGRLDDLATADLAKSASPHAAKPGKNQTVLFWSESDMDFASREKPVWRLDGLNERDFALPAADGEYTLTDLCGTPSRVAAAGGSLRLKSIRYPQYVEGLHGLRAAKPAEPRGRPVRYAPAPDEDLSVVIRAEVSKEDFAIGGIKSVAQLLAPEGRIAFEVWNLSETPKRGFLRCLSGGALEMPEGEIELPPMGMARVDALYAPPKGEEAPVLRVDGLFGGKRSTPVVIPVQPMGDFFATCEEVPVRADDPANWTRNDSADEYSCERDGDEVKFRVKWNAKADKWFYPKLRLRPEGGMDGAEFLAFEARSEQPGRANTFTTQQYWLDTADGRSARHDLPPTGTGWTRYRIPLRQPVDPSTGLPKLVPGEVSAIRLGGNPHGSELVFRFRNMRILSKREER